MATVISPHRLGHILLPRAGLGVLVAWVEGGGQPIVRTSTSPLERACEWAVSMGAEGVVARTSGEAQAYWWGPGKRIPFNKAEILPIKELRPQAVRPGGWSAPLAPVDPAGVRYVAYWSDRTWWSLNPDATSRRRPLLDGELQEILEIRGELADCLEPVHQDEATEVVVSRYDMFLEGGLHLRGMIREREVAELKIISTDAEDAVNRNFHAGPPESSTGPG